jgi:hypothetical protein
MSNKKSIINKIQSFLEIKDYQSAKIMSIEILSDLEKEGFPVYKTKDSKDTPYSEIFNDYLTIPFFPHPSPNSYALGWIMYAVEVNL